MQNLDEAIARSVNFGYLVAHEPMLAFDGASAESHVYTDPSTAMFKARRFIETMTRKAAAVLGVEFKGSSLYQRIDELHRAGVLAPWARQSFHYIRMTGSNAVHGSLLGDSHTALTAVRDCFDLGLWLHNTITGGHESRAFVPPQAPEALLAEKTDREPNALAMLLDVYRRRLAEEIDKDGAASPTWIRTSALAKALGRMCAEQANGNVLRTLEDELEARIAEVAQGADERLRRDRVIYGASLGDSARRAGEIGKAEIEQLGEIARELSAAAESRVPRVPSVVNVAGAYSNNVVVGAVYGGTVRQDRNGRRG